MGKKSPYLHLANQLNKNPSHLEPALYKALTQIHGD